MSTRLKQENTAILTTIGAYQAIAPLFVKYEYARASYIAVNAAATHYSWPERQAEQAEALNNLTKATEALKLGHTVYKAAFSAATQGKAW